jgi:hypothetical protein
VPERKGLVTQDTRDAAYRLLDEIRHAESARELLVYMRDFHSGASEFRNLINTVESALMAKIEEFARELEENIRQEMFSDADEPSGGRRGG